MNDEQGIRQAASMMGKRSADKRRRDPEAYSKMMSEYAKRPRPNARKKSTRGEQTNVV